MAPESTSRPVRHRNIRAQVRGERTRMSVIEETIACIREEGFAAASTRHIIDRAGVTWGVIQYYFGDRDGLLNSVIEHAFSTLIESLDELADAAAEEDDARRRAELLSEAAWRVFSTPTSMAALEILIATRAMRGTFSGEHLAELAAAIDRVAGSVGTSSPHAIPIVNLLWSSPVGTMVAQMVVGDALRTLPMQQATAALIGEHLAANEKKRPRGSAKDIRRRGDVSDNRP